MKQNGNGGPRGFGQRQDAPAVGEGVERFTPEQRDAMLVADARAIALYHITYQHLEAGGRRTAWESVRSFADSALMMASPEFERQYQACVRLAAKGEFPNRALWHFTSKELIRQGRLGKSRLPESSASDALVAEME
jgi:hypothetical protein